MTVNRRDFVRGCIAGSAALFATVTASRAGAQEDTRATTGAPMDQGAYRSVRLPAKLGARPVLTDAKRDELEHHIHCQCGCGLDVYTCRTTDFSCAVSPAMHLDVLGLVAGGYNGDEIIAAFRRSYGDGVLMEPAKEGFNWLAYTVPFAALLGGGTIVALLIKRWSNAATTLAPALPAPNATPDELARLRAALRNDE